jgi:hypothetical protein
MSSTTSHSDAAMRSMARKLMGLRARLRQWQHDNRELYRAAKYYKDLCEKQGKITPVPDPYAATLSRVAPTAARLACRSRIVVEPPPVGAQHAWRDLPRVIPRHRPWNPQPAREENP